MMKYTLEWTITDVEFVEALLLATGGEGGVPLQDILLMRDALDGGTFELAQLEQSLVKLTAAGCIVVQKNKIGLTPKFVTEHEAAATAVPEISDTERIQELLNCYELAETELQEAEVQLKKYKLKNYYQQYQEQFGS